LRYRPPFSPPPWYQPHFDPSPTHVLPLPKAVGTFIYFSHLKINKHKKKINKQTKKRNNINSNSNNNPCNNLSKTKKEVHFELVCNINKLTTTIINNDILHLNC